jgi:hypothetical protein
MQANEDIDLSRLRSAINHLLAKGVHGIFKPQLPFLGEKQRVQRAGQLLPDLDTVFGRLASGRARRSHRRHIALGVSDRSAQGMDFVAAHYLIRLLTICRISRVN